MGNTRNSPTRRSDRGSSNIDHITVASFGDEWSRFDQATLDPEELSRIFAQYFWIFPWAQLPSGAEGFDMGCGSGRWAKLVSPRVGRLNCVDLSDAALAVAKRNLSEFQNIRFLHAAADAVPLERASQDFGYSLGVLHHIPDTESALKSCVQLLKPGAPFLVYLYYRFDNRPFWFRAIWRSSEIIRGIVSRLPAGAKSTITDAVALVGYWPLAKLAWLGEQVGLDTRNAPLFFYRDKSFYTMRTDSRDRFGTPLEQRFSRAEIKTMMEVSGLERIAFHEDEPYWCAVGYRAR